MLIISQPCNMVFITIYYNNINSNNCKNFIKI